MILQNDKIELRAYSVVDKEEVRALYLKWMNDLNIVQAFGTYSILFPKSSNFIDESFERFTTESTTGFFIFDKDTNAYIGTCKLDKISIGNRSAEIGIMIGEENLQGKNIGTQTYELLLKYSFEVLGMNRVWGTCYADNEGSKKLFEKTGFVFEGAERSAIFRKGTYIDNLQYSILKEEYFNLR